MDKVTPWLWSNYNAEEMARFYTSLIPNSRITRIMRSPSDNPSVKEGDILTVEFELDGRSYAVLNGGAQYPFSEAVSFQITCDDQAEIDRYWNALSAHSENEECGWVKDKFGLSWQIVPRRLIELLAAPDTARAKRVMEAMLKMKKLIIADLENA